MKQLQQCMFLMMLVSGVQAEIVRIGFIEYPPHIQNINGQASGKLVDYMKLVVGQLNDSIEFSLYPKTRAEILLSNGVLDAVLPLSKRSENIEFVGPTLFTKVPGLCFRKENFIPILSAKRRLNGLRIGFGEGLVDFDLFDGAKPIFKSLYGANYTNRSLIMLKNNRLDAIYHVAPSHRVELNPTSCENIACSYFYGAEESAFIGVNSARRSKLLLNMLAVVNKKHQELSYDEYFNK